MPLDAAACYSALCARDARFDGHWFVGVRSTAIYCRPICRVRTPRPASCRFFESAALAEVHGFRPCLKCRPELAPAATLRWTVMDASRTLAHQAAHALDAQLGQGAAPKMNALAARLGISDRHLRRVFAAEHGVTPLQYLQTRRLLLAKHLLTDSSLPVTQIALASGWRSLRRFNAAFSGSYRMPPSRLRRATAAPGAAADRSVQADVVVRLGYRAPYDAATLCSFLARRAIPGVDGVDGVRLRRSVRGGSLGGCAHAAGWIEAAFEADAGRVTLRYAQQLAPASAGIVAAVRRWLDLDASPHAITEALHDLPGAPGLRLPGSLDPFELAVRAILGQQVTVAAARTLAGRLVVRHGGAIDTPWAAITRTFPAPDVLAATPAAELTALGILRQRAEAIVGLAQAWPALQPHFDQRGAPDALVTALCALRGIGPWTAHYIAMRALGWPDAFPPNDVAALKAIKTLFAHEGQRAADKLAEQWRPWRSYAVLRLWNTLEETI